MQSVQDLKVISGYSSTGCTCYLHWCISYFDSLTGSEVSIQQHFPLIRVMSMTQNYLMTKLRSLSFLEYEVPLRFIVSRSTLTRSGSVCWGPTMGSLSSCRAINPDIPDPFSPLLPIVHRFRQILRATPRILIDLLYVGSSKPCFCSAI